MFGTVTVPHCSVEYGPIVRLYVNVFMPSTTLTTPSEPATESVTAMDPSTSVTAAWLKSNVLVIVGKFGPGATGPVGTAVIDAVRGSPDESDALNVQSRPWSPSMTGNDAGTQAWVATTSSLPFLRVLNSTEASKIGACDIVIRPDTDQSLSTEPVRVAVTV